MIELDQVSKSFRTAPSPNRNAKVVQALRDVSLTVTKGSAVGVVGPNGAGKSTLFGVLLGFLRPTTRGAGYLPERFMLPGRWLVRDGLIALARLESLAEAVARADALLERFDLAVHGDKTVDALSRGLLQRLGLAQALLAARDLIVLDEPTEGLDPIWRLRLRELIAELRSEGRTLLIASHELNEIERFVDEAIVLENGAVRETIATARAADAARVYRIALREPLPASALIFPDARIDASDRVLHVTIADTADLSARLAALLEQGAVIESVTPADSLEQKVHTALGGA
jgi:ABC-2 type transport system ATP-binding protein